MPPLWEDSLPLRIRTVLRAGLSEIRTIPSSDWVIENCINYGTVYCYNTHYAGGIMGQ